MTDAADMAKRLERLSALWKTKARNAKKYDEFEYNDGYSDGLARAAQFLRREAEADYR